MTPASAATYAQHMEHRPEADSAGHDRPATRTRSIVAVIGCVALIALLLGLLVLRDNSPSATEGAVIYEFRGTVLEASGRVGPAHGPQMCAFVAESLPPQCSGPDIVGWDWSVVEGEESHAGTTWGLFTVRGTFVDGVMRITKRPRLLRPADIAASPTPPIVPPTRCPKPPSGWKPRVDGDAQYDQMGAAADRFLTRNPHVSAVWVEEPEDTIVFNVRFVRDAQRHETTLRKLFAGNLCVSEGGRPRDELQAIADAAIRSIPLSNGAGGSADELRGTVHVTVWLDWEGSLQRRFDEIYGPGIVDVSSLLTPV